MARRIAPLLAGYPWPGNWRELEHCLEAALMGTDPECRKVTLVDLSPRWQRKLGAGGIATCTDTPASTEFPQQLRELERLYMLRTLDAHGGNMTSAARALGISRSTLYRRLG